MQEQADRLDRRIEKVSGRLAQDKSTFSVLNELSTDVKHDLLDTQKRAASVLVKSSVGKLSALSGKQTRASSTAGARKSGSVNLTGGKLNSFDNKMLALDAQLAQLRRTPVDSSRGVQRWSSFPTDTN